MKTSEEMARSVMERARAHKAIRTRRLLTVTAAFVCVCSLGLAALTMGSEPDPGPAALQVQSTTEATASGSDVTTKPTDNDTVVIPPTNARVTLLCARTDLKEPVSMQADVKMPYLEVRVRDLEGLTQDERKAVSEAEKKYATDAVAEAKSYNWFITTNKDGLVSNISVGKFLLHLEDYTEVESIRITTGEIGAFWQIPPLEDEETGEDVPGEYYLNAKQVKTWYSADIPGGISMVWVLTPDKIGDLCLNPSTPLSTLQDTITITVNFNDGTQQILVIDLVFDDSGAVYAIYRGDTATV